MRLCESYIAVALDECARNFHVSSHDCEHERRVAVARRLQIDAHAFLKQTQHHIHILSFLVDSVMQSRSIALISVAHVGLELEYLDDEFKEALLCCHHEYCLAVLLAIDRSILLQQQIDAGNVLLNCLSRITSFDGCM